MFRMCGIYTCLELILLNPISCQTSKGCKQILTYWKIVVIRYMYKVDKS